MPEKFFLFNLIFHHKNQLLKKVNGAFTGHKVLFYPKFYCELKHIKYFFGVIEIVGQEKTVNTVLKNYERMFPNV